MKMAKLKNRIWTWWDLRDKQWHNKRLYLASMFLLSGRNLPAMSKLIGAKLHVVYNYKYQYGYNDKDYLETIVDNVMKNAVSLDKFKKKQWIERKRFLDKVYSQMKERILYKMAERLEISKSNLNKLNVEYKFYDANQRKQNHVLLR